MAEDQEVWSVQDAFSHDPEHQSTEILRASLVAKKFLNIKPASNLMRSAEHWPYILEQPQSVRH